MVDERDEARYHARVIASAWQTDSRPPHGSIKAALAYPVVNEWPCTCLPAPLDEPCDGCRRNAAERLKR